MKDPNSEYITLAVAGLHLQGESLNYQLTDKGAIFMDTQFTAPFYKMYLIKGGKFEKPGLARVGKNNMGHSFPVELWKVPKPLLADFIELIPHPLGIGTLELQGSNWVKGFVCEPNVVTDEIDISEFGSWRDYQASRVK